MKFILCPKNMASEHKIETTNRQLEICTLYKAGSLVSSRLYVGELDKDIWDNWLLQKVIRKSDAYIG